MSKIEFVWERKWIVLLGLVVLFVFSHFHNDNEDEEILPKETHSNEKQVEVITFGQWHPLQEREVLATVESDQEVEIVSEASGLIDQVLVNIGDSAKKGQVLARYKRDADPTQINYENALRNLSTTKLSAENLIKQAEIALDSASQEYRQVQLSNAQSKRQAFERLKTQAKNSEVLITNYLNWGDRLLGVSNIYRYENVSEREGIGAQDKVGKQDVKNKLEGLVYTKERRLKDLFPDADDIDLFSFAKDRLAFLLDTKDLAVS